MHTPRHFAKPLLCILVTCLVGASPANAQLSFEHVVVDSSGPQSIWGKSVGDLNQDGRPDLIAGGQDGGGLVWYENPSWTKRTIAQSGSFSTDHEVCDLDRDGDMDVVSLASSLVWYEAPSWTEHTIASETLHDIELLDFDGDGDCDVAGRNQGDFNGGGDTLYLYTQLSPTSWSATSMSIPVGEGLASADLDGDGDTDLAINELWIENRGANLGAWASHVYTSAWNHKNAYVAIADVDGDQRLDVILAPSEYEGASYRISWFEAPADPRQAGWVEHVVDGSAEAVHHFVGAGDFDRDGDMDIAAAEMEQGGNPDQVKIYRNDGSSFTAVVISDEGSHSMRVVDVDLDGDLDLYGANWQSDQVDLFINQTTAGALSLDSWQRRVLDENRPGTAIFIATDDLDGDQKVDVAAGGYWYRNPGSASGVWARSAFGSPLHNLAALHDFDGDGDVDVLGTEGFGSETAPDFVFGRNDGQGAFTSFANVASGGGDFLQGVTVARLSPGEPERVLLSWHADSNSVEALVVPGQPASDPWALESLSNASQQEALSHGDIDRDGDQDVLLGTVWLDNLGGSSFAARTLFQTGESPDRNRLADIDGDGRLDAVIGYEAISSTGVVAWYQQPADPRGDWSETVIAQLTGPMSLDVGDLDRDGDLDLVVGEHDLSNPANAGLFVFENLDGSGGSWARHTVHVGDEHHDGAQLVDIDSDGDLDIVSIGWEHGRVLLYENTAAATGPGDPGDPGEGSEQDPDLVAAWGFAGSGTLVADNTGNVHTGYLRDGATRSEAGHYGKALETDGVAGHVDLEGFDVPSAELSMMAWVQADDFDTADARILSKSWGTDADDHLWMLSTIDGAHFRFRLKTSDGGATSTLIGAAGTLSPGAWHHVAATYDGATMRLFQDGMEVGSLSKAGEVVGDPSIDTYIAANPGAPGQVFDGRIDDVKIFARALTTAEIQTEMNKPATPTSSVPPGCEFDEELGRVICPRPRCSLGPMQGIESDAILALMLLGLALWRRRPAC